MKDHRKLADFDIVGRENSPKDDHKERLLSQVKSRRVVLDERQIQQAQKMTILNYEFVVKLSVLFSVSYRTPIQKDVQDLFGYFRFFGCQDFGNSVKEFKNCTQFS